MWQVQDKVPNSTIVGPRGCWLTWSILAKRAFFTCLDPLAAPKWAILKAMLGMMTIHQQEHPKGNTTRAMVAAPLRRTPVLLLGASGAPSDAVVRDTTGRRHRNIEQAQPWAICGVSNQRTRRLVEHSGQTLDGPNSGPQRINASPTGFMWGHIQPEASVSTQPCPWDSVSKPDTEYALGSALQRAGEQQQVCTNGAPGLLQPGGGRMRPWCPTLCVQLATGGGGGGGFLQSITARCLASQATNRKRGGVGFAFQGRAPRALSAPNAEEACASVPPSPAHNAGARGLSQSAWHQYMAAAGQCRVPTSHTDCRKGAQTRDTQTAHQNLDMRDTRTPPLQSMRDHTPGGKALLLSGTSGAPTSAHGVPSGHEPHPSTRTGVPKNQSADTDEQGGGQRGTPPPPNGV